MCFLNVLIKIQKSIESTHIRIHQKLLGLPEKEYKVCNEKINQFNKKHRIKTDVTMQTSTLINYYHYSPYVKN